MTKKSVQDSAADKGAGPDSRPSPIDEAALSTQKKFKPASSKRQQLTSDEAAEIFELRPRLKGNIILKRGSMLMCKGIAPRFGISPKTVRDIWRGRTWLHATQHLWTDEEKKSKSIQDEAAMDRAQDSKSHSNPTKSSSAQIEISESSCKTEVLLSDRICYSETPTFVLNTVQPTASDKFRSALHEHTEIFARQVQPGSQIPLQCMSDWSWHGMAGRNSSPALCTPNWKEKRSPQMHPMLAAAAAAAAKTPPLDPALLRLLLCAAPAPAAYPPPPTLGLVCARPGPFPLQAGFQTPPGFGPAAGARWAGPL